MKIKYSDQDIELFIRMLSMPSTSGTERDMALSLAEWLRTGGNSVETLEVGDSTLDVLLKWGEPKVWFCSHCDTVPPYIAPRRSLVKAGRKLPDGAKAEADDVLFRGRGTCDAKGQLFSMFMACKELERRGANDFGLLVMSGEETGSFGAKAWDNMREGGDVVIVGEPTDNCMITSCKGTKSFSVRIVGKPCHSGYPSEGVSAIDRFADFVQWMHAVDFPADKVLGDTTWNIGKLKSNNPQNILSPEVTFRIYFRTTFASDAFVTELMDGWRSDTFIIEAHGGDSPSKFATVPGIPTKVAAFGSDAPRLTKFQTRCLCGPGSILVAHTAREYVLLSDLQKATAQYVRMYDHFSASQPDSATLWQLLPID